MPIVDAQVHLWNSGDPYPTHRQQSPFPAEAVLKEMDFAGVDRAILIAPRWEFDSNESTLDAARRYPDRFAVIGRIPLKDPGSPDRVARWLDQQGMLGIRLTFTSPETGWLEQGLADWYWPLAERHRIPTTLLIHAHQLAAIAAIAERHPGIPISIDHMAAPTRRLAGVADSSDEAAFAHLPQLLDLARLPNVAVKATTANTRSTAPYPHENIHPHIRRIVDAYGPQRVFWGSDLSRQADAGAYRECVTMFTEHMPWLTGRAKALVMGEAACNWYGWKA
jgi:predicted TIM-barrel fold metal-dependent hydrolase